MSTIAIALKHMLAAGMDNDAIIAAVEEMETAGVPQRTARQERNRRYYENKKTSEKRLNASETSELDTPLDKEGFPHTPSEEINPPKENPPLGGQKKNPRTILETVLSEAQAAAVVAHRKSLKKPLTDRAAELLAGKLRGATAIGFTPDQAADLMIERGWQGFELDWARNATPPKSESEANRAPTDDDWRKRLRYGRHEEAWFSKPWGPAPGRPGCLVPEHLIEPGDGQGWREAERNAA